MNKIEIFEPAMCCATGVCGPSVDPELLRITSIAKESKHSENTRIIRRNLAQNPNAFVRNEFIKEKIASKGMDALPITLVNEELLCEGRYPTNEEISEYLGIQLVGETVQ